MQVLRKWKNTWKTEKGDNLLYSILQSDEFLETMDKLRKKDQTTYERVKNKMKEILEMPQHFKPLGNLLKYYRRAHVGHFVIVFRIVEEQNAVKFVAYDHHDNIYKRSFSE